MECLVTKLKSIVDNGELRKIGELRIYLANAATPDYVNRRIRIISNPSQVLTCLGSGSFADGSGTPTSQTATAGTSLTTLVFTNGEFQVSAASKYDLTYLEARNSDVSFNIDDFAYCNKLETVYGNSQNDKGCLASLKDLQSFVDCRFSEPNGIYGNVKDLPASIRYIEFRSSGVTGDIASLGEHSNLVSLMFADTGVVGTLESFCEKQSLLRDSGDSITVNGIRTAVTYNGAVLNRAVTVTFDGQGGYTVA